ncbi:MAG: hypothetical protein BIFFINMI_02556 [Phycisphaerae bacterium]|nr:hypothetical protein [Phycisphaerae bacterium]
MDEVWQLERATVAEVHGRLARRRRIAYTTVLTTMRNLEKRGMLSHTQRGKAYVYRPTMPRQQYAAGTVRDFIDRIFAGRPEKLLCHILGTDEDMTAEDLDRIRRMIDDAGDESK